MLRFSTALLLSLLLAFAAGAIMLAAVTELTGTWRTGDVLTRIWVVFAGYITLSMAGLWGVLLPWAAFWSRDPEFFEPRVAGKILSGSLLAFAVIAALSNAPVKTYGLIAGMALVAYSASLERINWQLVQTQAGRSLRFMSYGAGVVGVGLLLVGALNRPELYAGRRIVELFTTDSVFTSAEREFVLSTALLAVGATFVALFVASAMYSSTKDTIKRNA